MSRFSMRLILTVATCSWALIAAAQVSERARGGSIEAGPAPRHVDSPWTLDIDSRLARRLDPQLAQDRRKAARIAAAETVEVIDGSKSPELLLPWELHRFLMSTAFYRDEKVALAWRRRFEAATPGLGVNDDFWRRLRDVSSAYLELRDRMHSPTMADAGGRAAATMSPNDATSAAREECHERMLALERANAEFGRDWLGRFLYLSVAPAVKVSSDRPLSAERHRFISAGCQ